MSVFNETQLLPSKPNASGKDAVLPKLGLLTLKSMPKPNALAGTTGADCMLVHQDVWEQLEGNKTTNILKNLTTEITGDEKWTVDHNFTMQVNGTTTDTRVDVHHQTNVKPRFDHYVNTRTETHDQPEVVHQPTTTMEHVFHFLDMHIEKHSINAFYWAANAVKIELAGLEATEKGVVLERKEMRLQNVPVDIAKKDAYIKLRAFVTEVVPLKLNASLSHLKAVASNLAAGIRGAFSAPWGS